MIKILFLITLVVSSLGQITRIQLPAATAVTLLDISVFFLVFIWVIGKLTQRERLKGMLLKPLLIFTFTCLLSLAINSFILKPHELLISFLYFIRWVGYALIYFVIKEQSNNFKTAMLKYLIGIIIAQVLIGFFQYFFYPNLMPLFYLGWDNHLFRMFGTLFDPNYQGALFVLFFCLLFNMTLHREKFLKDYRGAGLTILTIITLIAIVLTYSRSAFIMLLASLTTILINKGKKKIIVFVFSMTVIFIMLFSNVKIENLNPFRTASALARIEGMREALIIIKNTPTFGIGFNAYRYAQYRYDLRNPSPKIVSHADAGTDNSYLFIFATTGLIGFFAYCYLLWSIIKLGKNNTGIMGIILLSSIIGLSLNSLFINSFFYTFIMYWLWIIVGLTEKS